MAELWTTQVVNEITGKPSRGPLQQCFNGRQVRLQRSLKRGRRWGSRTGIQGRCDRNAATPEPFFGAAETAPSTQQRKQAERFGTQPLCLEEARVGAKKITGELSDLAEQAIDARTVLTNACWAADRARARAKVFARGGIRDAAAGRRRGRAVQAVKTGKSWSGRPAGARADPSPAGRRHPGRRHRGAGPHHARARPIARSRLGTTVEFGDKGQVVDNLDRIVPDHDVELGNPSDAPQLATAIDRSPSVPMEFRGQ